VGTTSTIITPTAKDTSSTTLPSTNDLDTAETKPTAGKSDGEGSASEDEEDEEEGENSDTDSELSPSPLDEFAPIFNYTSTTTTNSTTTASSTSNTSTNITANSTTTHQYSLLTALNSIPLDVGINRPITLSDLKPESVVHLQPFLEEWMEHVGAVNCAKITVSLV